MFPPQRQYHHILNSTDGLTVLAQIEIVAILVHYQPSCNTSHTMKVHYETQWPTAAHRCHFVLRDVSCVPNSKLTWHKGSLAGSCSILNVHNFIILFLSQIKWSWMAGGHNMEDLWGWRGPGFPTGPMDIHGGRSTKLHRGGQPPPADATSCWFRILITAGTGGCGIATRAPYIQPEIVAKINYRRWSKQSQAPSINKVLPESWFKKAPKEPDVVYVIFKWHRLWFLDQPAVIFVATQLFCYTSSC